MNLSELIKLLELELREHGDIDIWVNDNDSWVYSPMDESDITFEPNYDGKPSILLG